MKISKLGKTPSESFSTSFTCEHQARCVKLYQLFYQNKSYKSSFILKKNIYITKNSTLGYADKL